MKTIMKVFLPVLATLVFSITSYSQSINRSEKDQSHLRAYKQSETIENKISNQDPIRSLQKEVEGFYQIEVDTDGSQKFLINEVLLRGVKERMDKYSEVYWQYDEVTKVRILPRTTPKLFSREEKVKYLK